MDVKISKIEEREDALFPNNIETGYEKILGIDSEDFVAPVVGECFLLLSSDNYFRTSIVKEIIDENTFKTMNSIYRWEIINE